MGGALVRRLLPLAILIGVLPAGGVAQASVVVFANRSSSPVLFTVSQGVDRSFKLSPGDTLPIAMLPLAAIKVRFKSGDSEVDQPVRVDSAYAFRNADTGGVNLQWIEVRPRVGVDPGDVTAAQTASGERRKLPSLVKIPVKILVDDDERMSRKKWEERLRNRVAAASKILEKACRIGFEVVAVDTWDTDDDVKDYNRALAEFEHEVLPNPARLAIGFTSQYEDKNGLTNLGGTRASFYPYILLREWPRFHSEPERLEVLVHELAHYLGAVHSPDPDSVMRPVLGDAKARKKSFHVAVDPLNTLALYLIGEEYRARGNLRRLMELTPATRRRLFNIYSEIGAGLPDDPAWSQYIGLLGNVGPPRPATPSSGAPTSRPPRAAR